MAGLTLVLIALFTGSASAQCLDCHDWDDGYCDLGLHRAPGLMPPGAGGAGAGHGTHSGCLSSSCGLAHGVCGGQTRAEQFGGPLFADLSVEVFGRLTEIIDDGRWSDLVLLVAAAPDGFILVPERSSIQVVDCKGQALANYQIPLERLHWVRDRATIQIATMAII